MSKYISSKTYKHLGPVAYRQWRAESHCNNIHGYALSFYFEFEAETLDARNWVMDFGGLRFLYEYINTIFLKDYGEQDRIWCSRVEVRETDSNMAMKVGHREDGEFIDG